MRLLRRSAAAPEPAMPLLLRSCALLLALLPAAWGAACPVGSLGSYCLNDFAYPCLAGYFGAATGQTAPTCSGACSAPPGYGCAAGATSATPVLCPAGHFCPGGSPAPALPCGTPGNCAASGLSAEPPCDSWSVATLAGGGGTTGGFADGAGALARLNNPAGVAADAAGAVFVADYVNNRVRRVAPAGAAVTTLAGSGAAAHADGTGAAAAFNGPYGLALDPVSGDLFCADVYNNCIRRLTTAGVASTFAGDAAAGANWADGTGTAAGFFSPFGIAIDAAGVLFVADTNNQCIRRVTPAGAVTTLAGTGAVGSANGVGTTSATFSSPRGVAVDGAGTVFVGDDGSNLIRAISPAAVVTTFAGSGASGWADGAASAAAFKGPRLLALAANGNLLVADYGNSRVRVVSPAGAVATAAGGAAAGLQDGLGTAALLRFPSGVAVDAASGAVYVGDQLNQRVRRLACVTAAPTPSAPPSPSAVPSPSGRGASSSSSSSPSPSNLSPSASSTQSASALGGRAGTQSPSTSASPSAPARASPGASAPCPSGQGYCTTANITLPPLTAPPCSYFNPSTFLLLPAVLSSITAPLVENASPCNATVTEVLDTTTGVQLFSAPTTAGSTRTYSQPYPMFSGCSGVVTLLLSITWVRACAEPLPLPPVNATALATSVVSSVATLTRIVFVSSGSSEAYQLYGLVIGIIIAILALGLFVGGIVFYFAVLPDEAALRKAFRGKILNNHGSLRVLLANKYGGNIPVHKRTGQDFLERLYLCEKVVEAFRNAAVDLAANNFSALSAGDIVVAGVELRLPVLPLEHEGRSNKRALGMMLYEVLAQEWIQGLEVQVMQQLQQTTTTVPPFHLITPKRVKLMLHRLLTDDLQVDHRVDTYDDILATLREGEGTIRHPDVFISYAWGGKVNHVNGEPWVHGLSDPRRALATAWFLYLMDNDRHPWLDVAGFMGWDFLLSMRVGVTSCRDFLVLLSTDYPTRLNAMIELRLAVSLGKNIVPVLLDGFGNLPAYGRAMYVMNHQEGLRFLRGGGRNVACFDGIDLATRIERRLLSERRRIQPEGLLPNSDILTSIDLNRGGIWAVLQHLYNLLGALRGQRQEGAAGGAIVIGAGGAALAMRAPAAPPPVPPPALPGGVAHDEGP